MNVGSIGVATITPTTATPAAQNPTLEKPAEPLPLEAQNDNRTPPPPGTGQIVDKTV
jgi:hypothetical protein